MPLIWLIAIVLVLGAIGYVMGRQRALASAGGTARAMHSLPNYYGYNLFLFTAVPALLVLSAWLVAQPILVGSSVQSNITPAMIPEGGSAGLVMSDVRRLADGLDAAVSAGIMDTETARNTAADVGEIRNQLASLGVALGANVNQETLTLAQDYRGASAFWSVARDIVVILLALAGFGYAYSKTTANFRARNTVERFVLWMLIAAASIAILTTIGIVLSLVGNTIRFFGIYPASEFFFSTTWSPSFSGRGGSSELGILPLLWGTLYISLVALIVAVPIGLFSAIYLSEYASPRVRSIAKPALEVLAGIPTIVYGLFALLTVGPFL
ncbi:MAG: PstC family ABC transporter permease, partial [Shimia sp.]